jgi:arylsulfatase A-like enzyme
MHGLANPPWTYQLNDLNILLPKYLSDLGYDTAIGGVQHITRNRVDMIRNQGFQFLLNEDDLGEDVPDLHERTAKRIQEADPSRPWFMSIGFDQTHRDNRQGDPSTGACFSKPSRYDPESLDSRYCLPPALYPDTPETRQDFASFKEGALRLDERIGYVLDALEKAGQRDNTLVIVTTDHGIAWPGMKCNLTDHGVGVMLAMRGPGGFSGGKVIDASVTHLDLFPTIADLLDQAKPSWLQGESLLPLVRHEVDQIHDAIFVEQGWHEKAEPQRAVRTTRYKYIRRFDPIGPKALNCDESPTKNLLLPLGLFDRDLGEELLFDLYLDPQETNNRVNDPQLTDTLNNLRKRLKDWMVKTNDPLLSGNPVPPPGLTQDVVASK